MVQERWGNGLPVCGSLHLECSWDKGGAARSNRCNPDRDEFWRDHYAQENVAVSMTQKAKDKKPSLVINTADNFYYWGVDSVDDNTWNMMFEELYADTSLQIPWLSSLGNHDYGGHECDVCLFPAPPSPFSAWSRNPFDPRRDQPCSQAMIDYDTEHAWKWPDRKKSRWVLPMKKNDRWYMKSFEFKRANVTVDVFVIDTNKAHISSQCHGSCPQEQQGACANWFHQLWSRQRVWLLKALEESTAMWKMVVGHAPPENFEASLMDEMRDRGVSIYMAGHVHQLRHDRHPTGIEVVVSGSGGGYQSAGGGMAYTVHETEAYGFATLSVQPHQITVEYIDDRGQRLWDPIIIPKTNMQLTSALKHLQEAATALDVQGMISYMKQAREHGGDVQRVYFAALSGAQAFEAEGGMAWVHMKPKLMRQGEATFSGVLASWTDEASLPKGQVTLRLPASSNRDCCAPLGTHVAGSVLLCFAGGACSAEQKARNAALGNAAVVLLSSAPGQAPETPEDATAGTDNQTELAIPMISIAGNSVMNVQSWLGNPAEQISIDMFGGRKGYDKAIEAAEAAGVPHDLIERVKQQALQRKAVEHLERAMASRDVDSVRAAIQEAREAQVQSSEFDQASMWLQKLDLEAELATMPSCDDFQKIDEVIRHAKGLGLDVNETVLARRQDLATEALQAALERGKDCKEPMETAAAWCELSGVSEAVVAAAEASCEAAANAKPSDPDGGVPPLALAGAAALLCAVAVALIVPRCRKQVAASSEPAPAQQPGGIELLDQQ
eukprot:TRINITY_DN27199_c0_g2_i1.p1 TRINITY_DN27199_c0_g2~~TRINITY_DN27199_c0_g2_i1.p1  ORF type:complete len:917 (-),score=195.57 TRINITY_DN27199_c0_g2_i1:53-2392(-)